MTNSTDSDRARDALAAVHDSEKRLADHAAPCPPWRHAAFGALFFALIGSISISSEVQLLTLPFVLLGVVLLVRWDRRNRGMFVNGYRRGKTLPVTLMFVGVMIVEVMAAMHMRNQGFGDWSKLGLAILAFAIAIGFSLVWQRVFRQELTGGQS